MKKVVLILDGVNNGKTQFTQILMDNNYWLWSTNHRNYLSVLAHKVGWNGERNKNYYDFMEEYDALVNKYFDSQRQYVCEMIEKLLVSDRADKENETRENKLLAHIEIFYNLHDDVVQFIKKEYGAKNILISESNEKSLNHDFSLNCKDENYEKNVLNLIREIVGEK